MDSADLFTVLLIVLLIIMSGFFSSSEAAFLSLERGQLRHLTLQGVPGARRVADMVQDPGRLLSTILLGNNLVNVAFTALVTLTAVELLGDGQGVLAATVLGTAVLLIGGEIIPKTVAVHFAQPVALAYARPLKWTELLLWPFISVLRSMTRAVSTAIGADLTPRMSVNEAELRALIGVGETEGSLEKAEVERLEKVFRFGDRRVGEVMTPRPEVVAIERNATLAEFLEMYTQSPRTRLLVYEGEPDNVVGILSAKDVLAGMAGSGRDPDHPVGGMMRSTVFVPETKRVAQLFDEMRRSGDQLAVVVDEHGSVAGLVTLKRMLEELGGRVGEEGAAPAREYRVIRPNTYQVEGAMAIDNINTELQLNLPEGDYETVAGFILSVLGHIPVEGEQFRHEGLLFKVTSMKGVKIEAIELIKPRVRHTLDPTDPEGG